MADLESELLEAAGGTSGSGRNRHSRPPFRRQQEASYSDDSSESSDDNTDNNPRYAARKPSGCPVPLKKKRLDPSEKEDDRGSPGDDVDSADDEDMLSGSDESDIGSDLYKDEDDREQLAQLTELEREMILSERAQKRDDQLLTEKIRAKQSGKKSQTVKETPDAPSSRVRSSARFAEKTTAKDDALNELRAKRLKQKDPEADRKLRGAARGNSAVPDSLSVRGKSAMAAQSSDSSQSEKNQSQSHSRDEESEGDEDMCDSDEERSTKGDELTFEDIKEITMRRSKLAKWFMEPFFEETIVGCFVRVGIGKRENKPYYRVCIVKDVDATEPISQTSNTDWKTRAHTST